MKDSQKRLISASDFPFGSKSDPPVIAVVSDELRIAMSQNLDGSISRCPKQMHT